LIPNNDGGQGKQKQGKTGGLLIVAMLSTVSRETGQRLHQIRKSYLSVFVNFDLIAKRHSDLAKIQYLQSANNRRALQITATTQANNHPRYIPTLSQQRKYSPPPWLEDLDTTRCAIHQSLTAIRPSHWQQPHSNNGNWRWATMLLRASIGRGRGDRFRSSSPMAATLLPTTTMTTAAVITTTRCYHYHQQRRRQVPLAVAALPLLLLFFLSNVLPTVVQGAESGPLLGGLYTPTTDVSHMYVPFYFVA
jgi:hypothetical protein